MYCWHIFICAAGVQHVPYHSCWLRNWFRRSCLPLLALEATVEWYLQLNLKG